MDVCLNDVWSVCTRVRMSMFVVFAVCVCGVCLTVVQGLLGTVPWSAFSFNTMFFQYCAMSDLEAAVLTGSLLIGAAAGGVLGGLLGDHLFHWSRGHGRPLVGESPSRAMK